MTREDLEARIAIARAATPGQWMVGHGYEQSDPGYYVAQAEGSGLIVVSEDTLEYRDAAHIAANSPESIIALCEELMAAREEIAESSTSLQKSFLNHGESIEKRDVRISELEMIIADLTEQINTSRCQVCDSDELYIPIEVKP